MHARERQLSLEGGEGARVIKIHRFCVSRSVDDQGELTRKREREREKKTRRGAGKKLLSRI